MQYELYISDGKNVYYPVVNSKITWETQREDTPSKLSFQVLKDDVLKFENGNAVGFRVDGKNVFFGFCFAKEESSDSFISVTAYDQMRYLKNKFSYVIAGMKYSELLKKIAKDFLLKIGTIEDTGYTLTGKVEENKSLFDILGNASDETIIFGKKTFVLYDNYGKLTLKHIEKMKIPAEQFVVGAYKGKDYSYKRDIDTNTYNKVVLYKEDSETKKKTVQMEKDAGNIKKWGVLQYMEKYEENTKVDMKEKTKMLLDFYNKENISFSLKEQMGDIRARAGTSVYTYLDTAEKHIEQYLLIEKATHSFENNLHTMDLTLRGNLI